MASSSHRGPLLGGSYRFEDGFRVRLRMARSSDIAPIRRLVENRPGGHGPDLVSLVQFDPRRRCVICATALIDAAETLVGVGSINIAGDAEPEPDILLVAEEHAEEIASLLTDALQFRAAQAAETRAA